MESEAAATLPRPGRRPNESERVDSFWPIHLGPEDMDMSWMIIRAMVLADPPNASSSVSKASRASSVAAMKVIVNRDPDSLATFAASMVAAKIREWAGDTVTLAMAGGSTPRAMYHALKTLDVPWDRVHAWIGDERFVGQDHQDNNGAMARRELLDAVGAGVSLVPWRQDSDPHELAAEYERTLLGILDHDHNGPKPDLILAGIGDDGHTLSLFPGSEALSVTDRWYVANWVEQKQTWRLTTTLPLAHRARLILVLVAGEAKAEALAEILEPSGDERLPAARLMDGEAEVIWLIDQQAGSLLRHTRLDMVD